MAETTTAPAPAPAAPATPASAAAPAPSRQPQSAEGKPNLTSAFDNLDKIVSETSATPEPKGKPAEPDNDPNAPAETAPKPAETPEKPATPAQPAQPQKAKTLREAKEMAERQLTELQKKHTELEERLKKPQDDPEKKTLQEKIAANEKKLAELDEKLRYTNYEASDEYKQKFEKPFVDAYTTALAKIKALRVTDPGQKDDVTGVETPGKVRQATDADFNELMRMPDDDAAAEFAASRFGTKASIALYHREKVQELNNSRVAALEEFRQKGAEITKQQQELSSKAESEMKTAFETANKEAAEKYPGWFKPVEGDEKGNTLLQKGYEFADLAFDQKAMAQLPPAERAKVFSAVRNKVAGFDRMVFQKTMLQKRVTELETKLKEFEESGPDGGLDGKKARTASAAGEKLIDRADAAIERMAGMTR